MFEDGLKANLPKVKYHRLEKWAPGWIPEDCKYCLEASYLLMYNATSVKISQFVKAMLTRRFT